MSRAQHPDLEEQCTQELLAEAFAADRQRARRLISEAIRDAEAEWLEAPTIADALVLEVIEFALKHGASVALPERLRAIAQNIDARKHCH